MKELISQLESELLNKRTEIESRIRFLERTKQEVVKHLSNNRREKWLRSYEKRLCAYKKELAAVNGLNVNEDKKLKKISFISQNDDDNTNNKFNKNYINNTNYISKALGISVLSILFLSALVMFSPQFTELIRSNGITGASVIDASDNIYRFYTENTTEAFSLNYTINSLMVSGSVIGSGYAKMYLSYNNTILIIIDTNKINENGELIDESNQTNINYTRDANTTINFDNLCIETCSLENFSEQNITLFIEIENATFYLTKLSYDINNLTTGTDITNANETANLTENISAMTNISENIPAEIDINESVNISIDAINLSHELKKLRLSVKDKQKKDTANYSVAVKNGKYQLNITRIKKQKAAQPQGRFSILAEQSAEEKPAANIEINGLKTLDQNITAVIDAIVPNLDDAKEILNEKNIKTEVAAVNSIEIDNATITLPKNSADDKINAILSCSEFDIENFTCGSWEKTEIPFVDNGDSITFTVTHFSGYAGASISIINVQSYPIVGGNWTVRFTTNGTADLVITAIDETTFGSGAPDDLEFLELACNNGTDYAPVAFVFNGSSVIAENYSCASESFESSKVFTTGKHYLEFRFGEDVGYAFNDASPTACGVVNGSLTLTSSIITTGTCFVINLSNIILDCVGYNITSDGTGAGVNITNADNVSVKNCGIYNFSNGINIVNSTNSTIWNNTIITNVTNGHGIYLFTNSMNNNISKNNIFTKRDTAYPLYFTTSSNKNNVFFNNITTNGNTYAIYLWGVSENNISLNNITAMSGIALRATSNNSIVGNRILTVGVGGIGGLGLWGGSMNNTIVSNIVNSSITSYGALWIGGTTGDNKIIKNTLWSDSSSTIYMDDTSNNLILSNTVRGTVDGIYLESSQDNNISSNDFILDINSSRYGIYMLGAFNNTFAYNNITGNVTGILMYSGSSNNTFVSNNIKILNYTKYGILFDTGPNDNNIFINTFINATNTYDIFSQGGNNRNNTFINTTFNASDIGFDAGSNNDEIIIKWYVDATVANITSALQNANVTIYNVSNILVSQNLTDANGQIPRQTLTEFIQSRTTKTYSSPYQINVSLSGYLNATRTVNLTQTSSTAVTITMANDVGCGTISSSTLIGQNIDVNGTCFNISAHNIIIDGNGFTITGNSSGYGIDNQWGFDNVTIKNFGGINNFTNAIYASGTVNSTIFNNTIVAANVSDGYGIYLLSSSNSNNITSNTVTTSGSSGRGIYLFSSSNSTLTSNNITTSGGDGYGILLYSSSNSNTLTTNTITTSGSDGYGILLWLSSNSTLTSNNITTSGSSSGYGIYLYSSSNSNTLTSNTITTSGSDGYGIYLWSSSNSTLTSNTIRTTNPTSAWGIYLSLGSNNTFTNDNITATQVNDIRIDDGEGTFTNVTFTKTDIGFDSGATGSLTVQWYLDVTVNTSSGTALQNANVTTYNVSNIIVDSQLTSATGQINRLTLTEFEQNATRILYHTPHSINASLTSYLTNSTSINLTATSSTSVTLSMTPKCTTLTSSYTLDENLNVNGTCFTIGANNVVLDGNGYTITGNSSGYGINTNSYDNITIKNFKGINNFTNGIYASGTVNSTIFNNTIIGANVTNGQGIYLLSSSNSNNITSNNITTLGNTGYGIRLSLSSNSTLSSNTITTSGSDNYGIYLLSSANFNTLSSNTITTSGNTGLGILLSSSSNSILSNNIFTTSGSTSYGIMLGSSSNSNTLTFNNVTTSGSTGYGIYLSSSSDSTLSNNTITTSGSTGYGIYLSSSSNSNISSNTIRTSNTTAYAIILQSSYYNFIIDTFINATTARDIFLQTAASNNTLINVTFNKSDIGFNSATDTSSITVKYYVTANISQTNGAAISSATVSGYNVSNIIEQSALTGSNGLATLTLTEFEQNATRRLYHTPHSINATAATYFSNSTTVNLTATSSTSVTLTLSLVGCGSITESVTVGQNINVNGTCFQINANNIVLDCNGYTITGNSSGYGVNLTNRENVTVKNCKLINFSNGVYATGNGNHTIRDNVINISVASGYGIYLNNPDKNTLVNNTVTNIGSTGFGLYLSQSSDNNITSNSVTTSGSTGWGIRLQSSSNNNNLDLNRITTSGNDGVGIYLFSSNNNVTTNIITTSGSSAFGIILVATSNNIVTTNTITTSGSNSYGFQLSSSANNNSLNNNNITTSGISGYGFYIFDSSNNNNLNTNIINTSGWNGYGIYLSSSNNTNVTTNTITTSSNNEGYGIIFVSAYNNFIIDTFINATAARDIFLQTAASNNILINVTFNKSDIGFNSATDTSSITVKYYADVTINTSSGTALQNANVTTYNVSNIIVDSQLTSATGQITRLTLTEFEQNATRKLYHTPHSINASLTGYIENSTTINLTATSSTSVVLSMTPICTSLTSSYTLDRNVNVNGTCFTIGANNIVLDCNGYTITGNSSGYGVNITNRENVTVKNCKLINFSNGIYATGNGNHTIRDNVINTYVSQGYGIFLNNPDYNTLLNNTIVTYDTGGDDFGIYLSSATNNNLSKNNITTKGTSSYGVYLLSSSTFNILDSNLFATEGNSAYGAFISGSAYNNLTYNNITTTGPTGYGIDIQGSDNNIVTNNIIKTSNGLGVGILVYSGSDNNNLTSNTINTTGSSSHGIYIVTTSHNNNLNTNNIITSGSSAYGTYFADSFNNIIRDSVINATGARDIFLNAAYSNNTLINVTFNKSDIGFNSATDTSEITVKYYLDATVVNITSNLQNANVTIYNVSNILVSQNLTDVNGQIPRQTLIEFEQNATRKLYHTPHTVNVTLSPYMNATRIVNLTQTSSTSVTITMANDVGCGTISDNTLIGQNLNVNGTCFTIGADNIVLDCNGYTITGNNSGNSWYGVDITNMENVTVKNCVLINFSNGIYAQGKGNHTLRDNTITTNKTQGDGINLNTASRNIVFNNSINTSGDNSDGIVVGGSTNNNITKNTIVVYGSTIGGIKLSSNNNNISSNTITTYGVSVEGIDLQSSNNQVTNNTLTIFASSSAGMHIYGASNNQIASNNMIIYGSGGYGMHIRTTSNYNNITENSITNYGNGYGIWLRGDGPYGNNFTSNSITANGTSGYGAYIQSSYYNFFIDTKINATAARDIFLNSASSNNTLINTTFNKSDIGFASATDTSSITVKYYADVTINTSSGTALQNANVTTYNVSNIIVDSQLTSATGQINRLTLTEFEQNATRKLYHTPHSVNVTASSYLANSTTVNLTVTSSTSVTLSMTPKCTTLTSSYTLDENLNVSGTCFTIGANNIVLDGAGYNITGNGSGYGININSYNNITIKNFAGINNFTNGIYVSGTVNSTIFNNTIVGANGTSKYVITLFSSSNSNITSNVITASGSSSFGIYLSDSSNSTLTSNTITTSGTGNSNYGIYLSSSSSNTLNSNTITTNGTSTNFGIYLSGSSNSNTLTSNTITTGGTGNSNLGISLLSSSSNTLNSNTILTNGTGNNNYGISLSSSSSNTLNSNTITTNGTGNGNLGISLSSSSSNTLNSNTITTGVTSTNFGIYLSSSSNSNTLSSNTITTSGSTGYGISLDSSYYNFVIDTLINATNARDIFLTTAASNNTLINVTFNKSDIGFNSATDTSEITVKYYADVTINTSAGTALQNANVTTYNVSNIIVDSQLTNATGQINRLTLTEFEQNATRKLYHTPHSINASLTGYIENSTSINLTVTGSTAVSLSLSAQLSMANSTSCGLVNSSLTLSSNIVVNDTCFNVINDSIILDCSGYTITGNNSGYGVNITNRENVTVKNCKLINFSNGIYATGNGNHTIRDNVINTTFSTGYGIYLNGPDYNLLYNNTISTTGNNAIAIYLDSAINNNLTANSIKTTGVSNAVGMDLESNSDFNIIHSNIIITSNNFGIYLYGGASNNVSYNNVTSGGTALYFDIFGDNNIITFNNLTTTGSSYGINFQSGADANKLEDNNIRTSGSSLGIRLLSIDNNFTRLNIFTTGSDAYGIYIDTAFNNIFRDSVINATSSNDIFLKTAYSNNTLINVTFNKSDIGFNSATDTSSITVKYYADITVQNSSNTKLNATNVTTYNISNIIVDSQLTNTTGQIARQTLTEFEQNATRKLYHTPHTINTSSSLYDTNSTRINLTTTNSLALTIVLTPMNGTPTISTVDVIPDTPYTNDLLNCTLSASDPQGDTLSYFYQWYDNGTAISGATSQTFSCVTSGCDRGDNYTCVAIASDGTFNSSSKNAGEIIENTAPIAQDADVTPAAPLTTNTLTCSFTYSDADSDSQSGSAYLWYNNSILVPGLTSSTVDAAYTTSDETWFCQVTPKDGIDFGAAINSTSEAIGSSAPSISSYSDNSNTTNPTNVNTNVTFTLTWTDPDLPSENTRFFVCNSTSINTTGCRNGAKQYCNSSLSSTTTQTCKYTASLSDITNNNNVTNFTYYLAACDDSDLCSGSSSGIFEINRQPNITIPNVTPASPNTTSTLNCNYSYSDQDGDTELSTYRWYVSGALSSYNTKQINAANTTKLETWKCEVTPADEHNFTNAVLNSTNTVTIANIAPVIYSVQCHNGTGNINCYNITYGINLTNITVNCTDPDNDITNVSLQLFNKYDNEYKINTGNLTTYRNGFYVYDYNTLIEDSGNWSLNVSCIDTSSTIYNYTTNFSLAFGTLSPFLIFPSSENRDVAASAFFNFTSGVYCIGGECENISVILDPGEVNVIFTDQFEESSINTSRWNITGSPNITNATSYTGNKSLIINTTAISYITKNFTDSIKVGNISVWFYDSGERNLTYESQLALIGGEVPFSIGVNSTLNDTHYTYYLNGTFLTEVARTIGWHNLFVKVSTVTRVFIDSFSIRNTSLITTFTGFELGTKQTSNNTAYFDDFNYTVACEDSEAECKSCNNNFNYTASFPDSQAEGTYFGNCCGDDSSENYINTTAATDSTAACCNSSTSCVEGNTCFKAGANTTNYFCTLNDSKLCGQDSENDFALDNDNNAAGQGINETTRDFDWNYCFNNEDTVCGNESNGGSIGDLCDYFGDRVAGHGVCTKFYNNGTNTTYEQNDTDLTCAYSSAGYIIIATMLQDTNRTGCSVGEGNCILNETNMIVLNSSTLLSNYADRHCVNIQTFDIRNEIINYELDDDGNACVGCNYTLGTQTCSGEYDYNCTNTNTCEGVCGASSACDEGSASSCASNSTLGFCGSTCQINNTFELSQNACDCNQGSTSCSGGSCFNKTGNIIAFPTAEGVIGNCCGNDANETFRVATFNSSLTVSDSTRACCNSTTSCTSGSVCYKNQTYLDVDANADNDTCVEGTWYDCLNNSDCASDNHCYRRDCDQNPRVRNITISDSNVYFNAIIRCRVNVTDNEGMSNVRFNVTSPIGRLYESNGVYDGTQWLSGSITTNETGTWNCTALSNDSSGYAVTNTTNFTVFKKSELNNGVISIVNGTKPFYTISRNPTNLSYLACLSNLKGGQSCNQTWVVNASGSIGTKFEFYSIYNSTYHNNISAKVNITISGNVTPIVTQPVIIPSAPYRNNNLNCSWTVLDQDSANATVNITWSLNGISNKTETITCIESTTCYAPTGISNTTISKLQNWSCDVIAFDGSGYSASKNLTVMILNSPPGQLATISNISWNEDTNHTDAINLNSYFTDIDEDTLNYTTSSTQNVTLAINYTSFNLSLYPTADYNAELYAAQYIIINATDGTNTTSSNRVYLTIANTADCGFNGCESGETCSSCSQDCGQCASSTGGAPSAPSVVIAPVVQPVIAVPVEQKIKAEQEAPPVVIAPAAVVQAEAPAAVEAPTVIVAPVVQKEGGGTSNEIRITLKESESTSINVGEEEHSLTLEKINYISSIAINSVDLVIQSRYIKLKILVGETKYVDFEEDKKDDISITLVEIAEALEGKQATLKIIDLKTGKTLINKLFTLFKQDTAVSIQDAAACININKTDKSTAANEKVEIRQTTLDARTVLPKDLDQAVQPFALNCKGSTVSLTLNIPNNIVDLQALRCNKGVCKNIQLTKLDELNCGDKIKEDTALEQDALEQASATKIIEMNELSNETYESRNKVKILGIFDEELAKEIMPRITVPNESIKQPEDPNLKILSPPINIEFPLNIESLSIGSLELKENASKIKEDLDIEIIMPYVTDPLVDKNSISIYAKDTQLSKWESINSRINSQERTVTAIVRNASRYLIKKTITDSETQGTKEIYTSQFTLIGTICKDCEFSAFENIYFPAEASKATVILVHGLGSTPATYNAIINDIRLTKQPWQAWTFGYPSSRSSLDNGIELADNIERYNKEFQDIYIVAHSLGGLVTQKALNYAYEQNKANSSAYTFINKTKKAILVGVPNDKVAGSELFKQLFKYIINVRTQAGLFNADSVGIKELAYGQVISKVPSVEYLVIAGTKPYVIETALFTVRSDELFGLNESNDGIVTITGAQHVGGEYINDRCKNYWEIPETHTDLIKNPTARQIIEGIIAREISKDVKNKAVLGKNKYIELTIPDCSSEDKYAVVGKKISEEKVADASGCSCGNGFCGQDEDKISCPSDCANILRKETVCSPLFFSTVIVGILIAIFGIIASVYFISPDRDRLRRLIRRTCVILVILIIPVSLLNLFICGKTYIKIISVAALIVIFFVLLFALKKKPKTAVILESESSAQIPEPITIQSAELTADEHEKNMLKQELQGILQPDEKEIRKGIKRIEESHDAEDMIIIKTIEKDIFDAYANLRIDKITKVKLLLQKSLNASDRLYPKNRARIRMILDNLKEKIRLREYALKKVQYKKTVPDKNERYKKEIEKNALNRLNENKDKNEDSSNVRKLLDNAQKQLLQKTLQKRKHESGQFLKAPKADDKIKEIGHHKDISDRRLNLEHHHEDWKLHSSKFEPVPKEKEGKDNSKDEIINKIFNAHMQYTAGNLGKARHIYSKIIKKLSENQRQLNAKDRKAIKLSLNKLKELLFKRR